MMLHTTRLLCPLVPHPRTEPPSHGCGKTKVWMLVFQNIPTKGLVGNACVYIHEGSSVGVGVIV